ncbi:MAG: RNA-binding S4 domain-containing protein, partial [Planctomycetota bacterium]
GAKTHPKEAKVLLGKTIVSQFYDKAKAESAAAEFEKVFAQKQLPDEIAEISIGSDAIAAAKLLTQCKLVASGGEAKRMIKQGGATIDGEKISDPNLEITPSDGMIIQVGKRKFAKLSVK